MRRRNELRNHGDGYYRGDRIKLTSITPSVGSRRLRDTDHLAKILPAHTPVRPNFRYRVPLIRLPGETLLTQTSSGRHTAHSPYVYVWVSSGGIILCESTPPNSHPPSSQLHPGEVWSVRGRKTHYSVSEPFFWVIVSTRMSNAMLLSDGELANRQRW